jgi:hypothetical protein
MKIHEFLEEDNGDFSATRLALLAWVLGVLGVWLWLSILGRQMASIENSVVTILGILMTGKVTQKFGEKSPQTGTSPPVNTPPPTNAGS